MAAIAFGAGGSGHNVNSAFLFIPFNPTPQLRW